MHLNPAARVVQSSRTASRVVDGHAVVVVIDEQALHTLNEVGTYVWERADGRPLSSIVTDVVDEFEVEPDAAARDVLLFVEKMLGLGALEILETTA